MSERASRAQDCPRCQGRCAQQQVRTFSIIDYSALTGELYRHRLETPTVRRSLLTAFVRWKVAMALTITPRLKSVTSHRCFRLTLEHPGLLHRLITMRRPPPETCQMRPPRLAQAAIVVSRDCPLSVLDAEIKIAYSMAGSPVRDPDSMLQIGFDQYPVDQVSSTTGERREESDAFLPYAVDQVRVTRCSCEHH